MAIATYHFYPAPGETNKSPVGGCWIAGANVSSGTLKGFPPGAMPGTPTSRIALPPTYYPEGYWLPAGTTQFAKLFSATNLGRIIEYYPWQYEPRAVRRLRQQIARVRQNGEELGVRLGWNREAVERWIAANGPSPAQVRRAERAAAGGLQPGEVFVGKPVIVLFDLGTPANVRRQMVLRIWQDIEEALEGS